MTNVDYQSFDDLLMNSTSRPSIAHGLQPVGFAYAIYDAGTAPAISKHQSALGIRAPGNKVWSNHSVKESDSMSKTVTTGIFMHQLSKVPDVHTAFSAYVNAAPADKAAKHDAWKARVDHYLERTIAHYLPGISGTNTDWTAFPAAQKIRIKDLLLHTSGLSVTVGSDGNLVSAGGDDWVTIEGDLQHWHLARYQDVQTNSQYSNTNFALFRYIIPFFHLIAVQGMSEHDAHLQFHGDWTARNSQFAERYRQLGRSTVFGSLSDPRPDVFPFGEDVWYFPPGGSGTPWDITNSQPDWSIIAGAWGWKMSAHQYAHALAGIVSGETTPAAYWNVMKTTMNAGNGGLGLYHVPSAHPSIGEYRTHDGGDGQGAAAGGGVWYEWDDKVFVFFQNSPFLPPSSGSTDDGYRLFLAFDHALANSII